MTIFSLVSYEPSGSWTHNLRFTLLLQVEEVTFELELIGVVIWLKITISIT